MLRIASSICIAISFTLVAAQPVNDDCANPIDFGDITTAQSLMVDFSQATESLDASCESTANTNYDLWYSFTMPFFGNVVVDGLGGVDRMTLYTQCGGSEISCSAGDQFIQALTVQTYLVRFSTTLGNRIINPQIQAFTLAAHDDCSAAIAINNIENEQSIQVDTRNATESLVLSCDFSASGNLDLWYVFVMPFDGRIILNGVFSTSRVALMDACAGSPQELGCNQGDGFFDNLAAGETYYFRYAAPSAFAGPDAFTIQAFDLAANDDCASPEILPDITGQISVIPDTRHASQTLQASCETNPDNWDLWYSFVMPFAGSVQVTGVFGVNRIAVFDACNGSEITCFTNSGFIYGLQSGQNYLLRYATVPQQAGPDQIFIQAFQPPAHDECSAAIDIGDISTQQSLTVDTRTATESLDVSCENASLQNLDLWYKFTMPFTGKVHITGVFGVNKLTIFDGCGGSELACEQGFSFFYGLQVGVEYIVRYAASSVHAGQDEIFVEAFPPPPNDECTSPIILPDPDQEIVLALDSREATESLNASCEDPNENHLDLWYEINMPYDGNLKVSGVFGNNRVGLYDQCGQNELTCVIGNAHFLSLLGGQNYLLRYAAIEPQAGADEVFIQSYAAATNDYCQQALELGDISIGQNIQANNAGATEEINISCEISANQNLDLWYTFEMPLNGQVNITGSSSTFRFALFEMCGATELACFSGNGSFGNLSSGIRYYLRYASTSLSAAQSQFSIDASASLPITLVSFEAYRQSVDQVIIRWATISEINNAGFVVERSESGHHWTDIAWVPGQGDSKTRTGYEIIDYESSGQPVFYRLLQVDHDGSSSYSSILSVAAHNSSIELYPNPADHQIFLQGVAHGHVTMYASDQSVVLSRVVDQGALDVSNLPRGLYYVEINTASYSQVKKLILH